MIQLIKTTWLNRLLRWARPKDQIMVLAWQRARRALRSKPKVISNSDQRIYPECPRPFKYGKDVKLWGKK